MSHASGSCRRSLVNEWKGVKVSYFKELVELIRRTIQSIVGTDPARSGDPALDDVLAKHADALVFGGGNRQDLLRQWPDEAELATLAPLAEKVNAALRPVSPSAAFKNRLYSDLMRQAGCRPSPPSLWEERRKEIIIGATITSVLSAAGVLAYIIYQHSPQSRSHVHSGGAGGGPGLS
jgi:hypothetical protein